MFWFFNKNKIKELEEKLEKVEKEKREKANLETIKNMVKDLKWIFSLEKSRFEDKYTLFIKDKDWPKIYEGIRWHSIVFSFNEIYYFLLWYTTSQKYK